MIKFFRKIRQNLLIQNNTGKYFKYAIGEIVLVVIGILIALSINNWNQERVSKNKAYSYLNQINNDLTLDLMFYEDQIYRWSEYIFIFDKVVKSDVKNDRLIAELGSILTVNSDPREFGNSYNNLLNSGDIDLIENKALLAQFQKYYLISCEFYNNKSAYHKTFMVHNIEGPLVQKLVLNGDDSFSIESLKKEMTSGNLNSMINWQNNAYKSLIKILKRNQKEAQELKRLIRGLDKKKANDAVSN